MQPHNPPPKKPTTDDDTVSWWHWATYLVLMLTVLEALFNLLGGLLGTISNTAQAALDAWGQRPSILPPYPFALHWQTVLSTLPTPLVVVLLLDGIRRFSGADSPWQFSHVQWRIRTMLWFILLHGLLHVTLALLEWGETWQYEAQSWPLLYGATSALYLWLLLRWGRGIIRLDNRQAMPVGIGHPDHRWRQIWSRLPLPRLPVLGLWYWGTTATLWLAAASCTTFLLSGYRTPERHNLWNLWLISDGQWLLAWAALLCCLDTGLARAAHAWQPRLLRRAHTLGWFIAMQVLLLSLPWFVGEDLAEGPVGMLAGILLQCLLYLWLFYPVDQTRPRAKPASASQTAEKSAPLFWNQAGYFLLVLAASAPLLRCAFGLMNIPLPAFGVAHWETQPLFHTMHSLSIFTWQKAPNSLSSWLWLVFISLPPLLVVTLLLDVCGKHAAGNTWQASHYRWRIHTMLWFLLLHTLQQISYAPLLNQLMWHGGPHFLWVFSCWNASIYLWLLYRNLRGWLRLRAGIPAGRAPTPLKKPQLSFA